MHFIAFNAIRDADVRAMPTHMFDVGRSLQPNINVAGFHVAHILNAKNGNTRWREWSASGHGASFSEECSSVQLLLHC
jgi:hypothetical protein